MEAIIAAIITGVISLVGTVASVLISNNKLTQDIRTHNAVQDTKIEELTREVRAHNGFAERIPRLEQRLEYLEKQVERR